MPSSCCWAGTSSCRRCCPTARLHLARGDHDLARAVARRGLRVAGSDRLRAAELLTVLVDAELARGDVAAATRGVRRAGRADRRRRRPAAARPQRLRQVAGAGRRRRRAGRGRRARATSSARSTRPSCPWCGPACCWRWRGPTTWPATTCAARQAARAGRRAARAHRRRRRPRRRRAARPPRAHRPAPSSTAPAPAVLAHDGRWWTASSDAHERAAARQQGPALPGRAAPRARRRAPRAGPRRSGRGRRSGCRPAPPRRCRPGRRRRGPGRLPTAHRGAARGDRRRRGRRPPRRSPRPGMPSSRPSSASSPRPSGWAAGTGRRRRPPNGPGST